MIDNVQVVVARFTEITCQEKVYLTDPDSKAVKVFYNQDSAKLFLQETFKLSDDDLNSFIYEPLDDYLNSL